MSIEAVIGVIGAQLLILLPLYFAHRQKMATLKSQHDTALAELQSKTNADARGVDADFRAQMFDAAEKVVQRLSNEVDRLSAEVVRLQKENTRLSHEVAELRTELQRTQPPRDAT